MKKQLLYLITAISIAIGFASCEEGSNESISAFTNYDKGELKQTISAEETSIKGGFTFTTTEDWSASVGDAKWITISPDNGKAGKHTINITTTPNPNTEDRSAKISINSGESTLTINIMQIGNEESSFTNYDKEFLKQVLFANDTETKGNFSFTAKAAWSISIENITKVGDNNSWVTVSPMNGNAGTNEISIKLDINDTGKDRFIKVDIKSGESIISIIITQKATTEESEKPSPKVITSIEENKVTSDQKLTSIYNFEYDNSWQLILMTAITDGHTDKLSLMYLDNGIQQVSPKEDAMHNLNGDVVTSSNVKVNPVIDGDYVSSIINYTNLLHYDNSGYVQYSKYSRKIDNNKTIIYRHDILRSGNNITNVKITSTPSFDKEYDKGTTIISYSKYANNTNLDLTTYICETDGLANAYGDYPYIPAIIRKVGKANANLIDKEVATYNNHPYGVVKQVYSYTYKFDVEEYPTEITISPTTSYHPDYTGDKYNGSIIKYSIKYNK